MITSLYQFGTNPNPKSMSRLRLFPVPRHASINAVLRTNQIAKHVRRKRYPKAHAYPGYFLANSLVFSKSKIWSWSVNVVLDEPGSRSIITAQGPSAFA